MKTSDFDYFLPESLVAQAPPEKRTDSRLLYVPSGDGEIKDKQFKDVLNHFNSGDCLVLNDTRVIPARMLGQKSSGGRLELLVERVLSSHTALCHIRCSRSPKAGTDILLEGAVNAQVTGREGALFLVEFDKTKPLLEWLDEFGHMPLPPYIERADEKSDRSRYQTVFSQHLGAVAAPTAGLHFDERLLEQIKAKGVEIVTVTLHVGAGTFKPVQVDEIEDHEMHSEWVEVSQATADCINKTHERGGKVIAIGTTVVRSLESAPSQAQDESKISGWTGETDIFITPGFKFRFVDQLVTNFHLPKSTLLMLVSAFAGKNKIFNAYKHAVESEYRFFSYGDAMLIECEKERTK